ncbi:hypothetical protein D3C79_772140 [compost metagenome]
MQRVGDHAAGQHLLHGQRLAVEHRLRVGLGVGALVHGDFRQGPRVVTVLRGVALGDHRVAGVLAHVPVRQVEFCLWRPECRAVAAKSHGPGHPARVFIRPQRRHARRQHAQHRLAQAQFDGGSGAPDHTNRGASTQVDHFGEVQPQAQVFSGHGRDEHRRFVELRPVDYQAVQIRGLQAGIAQGLGGQIGDLFKVEHLRCRGVLFRLVLGGTDNCCVAFEPHGASVPAPAGASVVR